MHPASPSARRALFAPALWVSALLAVALAAPAATAQPGSASEPGTANAGAETRREGEPEGARPDSDEARPGAVDEAVDGAAAKTPARVFDSVLVTGGPERVREIPGSADYLGVEELARQEYDDLHRVLRSAPGVNLQEEDGYGLRPNIGMRGTGVERSQKITLLEDGVLIAPAPYAAPAAYYSPSPGRIEAVEVRKGSSSIRQGPYTNGGVINLVSSSIPGVPGGRLRGAFGSDRTAKAHALVGGMGRRFGFLAETFRFATDGFKRLDGGGPTGVDLEDYVGKLRWSSGASASLPQTVEVKLGRTYQFGEETYLGLTDADFAATPSRRYAASREDWIDTRHGQAQLRWLVQPGSSFELTGTAYRNAFSRNWHKLQSVEGRGLASVLDAPSSFPRELAILRGELDAAGGPLAIRNNRREYLSRGVEGLAGWRLETGRAEHRLEAGLRLHEDEEDRFQEEDLWNIVGGRMRLEALGAPGSQSNRVSSAEATALFVRDEILFGRWTLSPGVRYESIDFSRADFGRADPQRDGLELRRRDNGVDVWLPGVGVSWAAAPSWNLFGGVHRGFSPPGPGASADTDAETSVNFEAGFDLRRQRLRSRVVAFYNDYDNLLGRDTLASGGEGTGDAFNGGAATIFGLEAVVSGDLARASAEVSLPLRLTYTYTSAEFDTSFATGFADWAPAVEAGDEIPYVPEQQANLSLGLERRAWSAYLDAAWSGRLRTEPGTGPPAPGTGIDDRLVLDLALRYRARPSLTVFAEVRNLADEVYLAARRPAGARPGLPRTLLTGVTWEF